jgi:hypothetical protein
MWPAQTTIKSCKPSPNWCRRKWKGWSFRKTKTENSTVHPTMFSSKKTACRASPRKTKRRSNTAGGCADGSINSNPQYVTDADGAFETQPQSFQFGSNELAGLKIFLTEGGTGPLSANTIQNGKVGNCVACHTPPAFSDFLFHNTGATQEEYDSIHGDGAFAQIFVPNLSQRSHNPAYPPASSSHRRLRLTKKPEP